MFSHEETAAGSACREEWYARNRLTNYRSKVRTMQRQLERKGAASGRSGGTRDQWQPAAEDQSAAAADVEMREPQEAAEVVEPKAMPKPRWKEAGAGKKDPEHAEDSDSSLSSTHEKGSVAAHWQQKGREEDIRMRGEIQRKVKADLKKHPPPWRGSVAAYRQAGSEEPQAGQSSSSKGEAKNQLQLVGKLPVRLRTW